MLLKLLKKIITLAPGRLLLVFTLASITTAISTVTWLGNEDSWMFIIGMSCLSQAITTLTKTHVLRRINISIFYTLEASIMQDMLPTQHGKFIKFMRDRYLRFVDFMDDAVNAVMALVQTLPTFVGVIVAMDAAISRGIGQQNAARAYLFIIGLNMIGSYIVYKIVAIGSNKAVSDVDRVDELNAVISLNTDRLNRAHQRYDKKSYATHIDHNSTVIKDIYKMHFDAVTYETYAMLVPLIVSTICTHRVLWDNNIRTYALWYQFNMLATSLCTLVTDLNTLILRHTEVLTHFIELCGTYGSASLTSIVCLDAKWPDEAAGCGSFRVSLHATVPSLDLCKEFELKPGLNRFVGKKGSGKSLTTSILSNMVDPSDMSAFELTVVHNGTTLKDQVASVAMAKNVLALTQKDSILCDTPVPVSDIFHEHMDDLATINALIDRFGLRVLIPDIMTTKLSRMISGGQERTLTMILNLMHVKKLNMPIIVFDEPDAGLDMDSATQLYRYIKDEIDHGLLQGRVVILIAHSLPVDTEAVNIIRFV